MRLLVVGGAGYVGRIIQPALEAENQCTYYDRRPMPGAEAQSLVADVNDDARVHQAVEGVDALLYLAMGAFNSDGSASLDSSFDVNVKALYRFLRHALAAGVRRFCYASTLSIYQNYVGVPHMDETVPPDCWEIYGLSKRAGELVCQAAGQRCPDATIIALRLCAPRNEQDWSRIITSPNKAGYYCALGPGDTRRLFAAALRCDRPGVHLVQATGDVSGEGYSYRRAEALLGWRPQGC